MTKQILSAIATLGLVVSVSANAAMKSEFFYQTDADKNQLTPEIVYNTKSVKFKSAGTNETDTKATTLNLRYERGINEMLSAGVLLPYTMTTEETDTGTTAKTDISGLGNIALFLKGNYTLVEGQALWYGADLSLSPGDATIKAKSSKNEENNYTGGHSLNPYVGYSMLMASYVVGAKLSTQLAIGDRTVKSTDINGVETKEKKSGGVTTALTVFGEMPITAGNVGAKVTYAGVNTTKNKEANTTEAGYTTIALGLYGNYDVSETAAVVGGLDYTKLASKYAGGQEVDSTSDIALNVGGRFTF